MKFHTLIAFAPTGKATGIDFEHPWPLEGLPPGEILDCLPRLMSFD